MRAQDVEPKYKTPDTNNAIIRGRVTLPSGFAAEGYARITLRNQQSVLSTIYTNNSGEFQIRNLSEGTYYVQAEVSGNFDPVTHKVELGRGLMVDLNFELRPKHDLNLNRFGKVVSAAELRQSVPAAAKKQYELGLKFVNKGNFQQAATHFQEAVTIYPEYLAARNDLGAQYLKLKQIDEAEKHFQIVLQQDAKNFNAKFNMGLVQIERRNYVEAISLLQQAVAIDSTRPVARLWIGIAKLEMGEIEIAEAELTRALIMGGDECVAAHYHLARIYMTRGDRPEAARSVRTYIQLAPKGELIKEAKALAHQLENDR
ncbi:MAG TPA: tetratricopeptide repeat protein [Pyrinomonadaceae bacterium]